MGIVRSTYYDAPKRAVDDTALVEAMHAIKDEFEADGWRRMQAALGQQGWVVNHKRLKRLMREHGLNARRRRRLRHDHRQRPRPAGLPEQNEGHDRRRPGPALGRRPDLRRRGRRLPGAHSNAMSVPDPTGARKPVKERSTGRIDGLVAATMAISAGVEVAPKQPSV
jgi:transposase InsO family protein